MSHDGFVLVLQDAANEPSVPRPERMETWARMVFGGRGGELVIRIVDEAESAALNETYRGKPGPTNVLAFPPGDEAFAGIPMLAGEEPIALGDLAVCAAVVAREAAEQGKTAEAHWAHIVIHGCLHLIGHDHLREAEAAAMEGRERELLAALGIADPYAV